MKAKISRKNAEAQRKNAKEEGARGETRRGEASRHSPPSVFLLCAFAALREVFLPGAVAAPPTFVVRKTNGTEIRAPLASVDETFRLEVGTKILRKLAADEWLSLRRADLDLPPLPSDEQIVLASGDRIPARDVRLDDEKLRFRHPDLEGGKDSVVPIAAVAMVWRLATDGTVNAARQRNDLLRGKRKRDTLLLRNGDRIEGTLEALSVNEIEVEIARKKVVTKWPQVSAVLLSTDLTEKARPNASQARLVLSATERSPGGRFTIVAPSCDWGDVQRENDVRRGPPRAHRARRIPRPAGGPRRAALGVDAKRVRLHVLSRREVRLPGRCERPGARPPPGRFTLR